MSELKKIVVIQAEGPSAVCDIPYTYEGATCVTDAEAKLREIAADGPDSGYYKTDVTVTLADGTEIGLRFDVERIGSPHNDIEIIPHLRRYLEIYSGKVVPAHLDSKFTPEQWLQWVCNQYGTEFTMEIARCLEVLNA